MKNNRQRIKAYKKRWETVNAWQEAETAKLSLKQKFRQLASLVELGLKMGVDSQKNRGDREIRLRWSQLRKQMHG